MSESSVPKDHAFIIDGATLIFALDEMPELFLELGEKCQSVICCRVTPKQKVTSAFCLIDFSL